MQAIVGGDVRRVVGTSATPINNFMHWFEAILANMNLEAQRALAASRKAPSVFAEAQNMAELSLRQELQCIRETEHLRYIRAMMVWFKHWKQDQGWWAPIPTCSFHVRAPTTVNIETRVMLVITQVNMSQGESQVLQVLITLQYLAEVGLKNHRACSTQRAIDNETP